MVRFTLVKAFAWPQPNLGQVYVGAAARRAGHDVSIVDMTFSSPTESHSNSLAELERERNCGQNPHDLTLLKVISKKVVKQRPDVVGLAATSFNVQSQLKLADALKEALPEVRVVVGGVEPTLHPGSVLSHPSVDAVCIGEGEESIPEYLCSLEDNSDREVRGIRSDTHPGTELRPFVSDLDGLPFPDWDGWPINEYANQHHLPGSLPVLASRGCVYQCTFCTAPFLARRIPGKSFRLRSPFNVIDEVRTLKSRYSSAGLRSVTFLDETFGLVPSHFRHLMHLYRRESLHEEMPWDCQTRPDLLTREWAREARRSGCIVVRLGIDHGIESVRNHWYKRNITDTQIRTAVRNLQQEGILVVANIIFGGPFESRESLHQSLKFTFSLGTEFVSPSVLFSLPGTELQQLIGAEQDGNGQPKIAASDDLPEKQLMDEYFSACRTLTRRQCSLALRRIGPRLPIIAMKAARRLFEGTVNLSTYRNPRNMTLFSFIIEDAMEKYLHQCR